MKKLFTQEEINLLNQNPYTASVTEKYIRFTLEFKLTAFEKLQSGVKPSKIFKEAGYDTGLLGNARIQSVMKKIKQDAASPKGIQPPKGMTKQKQAEIFANADLSKLKTDTAIKEMQEKIVKLEQQVEFLSNVFF